MTTICAEIQVKDADWILGECLRHLSDFVDEVVAFDDGSSDLTLPLLLSWPCVKKIFRKPTSGVWTESENRALLLDMAKTSGKEWILFIDSDEILEARAARGIKTFLQERPEISTWKCGEINLWNSTHTYRCDDWFGFGKDNFPQFVRFFRNDPDLVYRHTEGLHGNLVPVNVKYPVLNSGFNILHFAFFDPIRRQRKAAYYRERDVSLRNASEDDPLLIMNVKRLVSTPKLPLVEVDTSWWTHGQVELPLLDCDAPVGPFIQHDSDTRNRVWGKALWGNWDKSGKVWFGTPTCESREVTRHELVLLYFEAKRSGKDICELFQRS